MMRTLDEIMTLTSYYRSYKNIVSSIWNQIHSESFTPKIKIKNSNNFGSYQLFYMCNAFQNLDDLEKFYKLRPAFDAFGASSKFLFNQSGRAEWVIRPG